MTNPDYTYIASLLDQVPEVPADSILSRTFYSDDRVKAILFVFAPGQELSEHTASQPAILQIIQGEADLTLGSDAQEGRAGTWVYMPPQLPHSLRAKSPVVMLLYLLRPTK